MGPIILFGAANVISQSAEYALCAVIYLGERPGRPLTTGEIAAATGTPMTYLAKVLGGLKRAGVVSAQRGLGGGFVLSRSPDELTVLEVINAVDPVRRHEQCPFGLEAHRLRLCALHRRLNEGIGLMERLFEATPIRELLEEAVPSTATVATRELDGPTARPDAAVPHCPGHPACGGGRARDRESFEKGGTP